MANGDVTGVQSRSILPDWIPFHSSDVIGATILTGLALATLATLALVGHYYPTSALTILTKAVAYGTAAMIGSELVLLALGVVVKCCGKKPKKKKPERTPHPPKGSQITLQTRESRGTGSMQNTREKQIEDGHVSFE